MDKIKRGVNKIDYSVCTITCPLFAKVTSSLDIISFLQDFRHVQHD